MRFHTLIPYSGLFAFVFLGASAFAVAQSASFAVSQNGTSVGTASFNFVSKPEGYDSTSIVHVDMQGLNYKLSKTEQLSPSNALLHVQLSAIVNNSAVNVVAKPDAAQFLLNISANGRASTTRLDSHDRAVFLPDFDPGALEQRSSPWPRATTTATSGPSSPNRPAPSRPVKLATYADEQGTLDGKISHRPPLDRDHRRKYHRPLRRPREPSFSRPNCHKEGFALVRNGFYVLTPPAKPIAPPPDPPATSPSPTG